MSLKNAVEITALLLEEQWIFMPCPLMLLRVTTKKNQAKMLEFLK